MGKPAWSMKPPELVDAPQTDKDAFVSEGTSKPAPGAEGTRKPKGKVQRADGTEARRLVVYLPPELMQRLRVHCAEAEVSLSEVVGEAVAGHLATSTEG